MKFKTSVPSWLIIIAVIVTAAITTWAMLQRSNTKEWPGQTMYTVQQMPQVLYPATAAFNNSGVQVAATQAIGAITAGAVSPHGDRGTCTSCHTVLNSRAQRIPMINATSVMPHEYRGVCSNCHQISSQHGQQSATGPLAPSAALYQGTKVAFVGQVPMTPPAQVGAMGQPALASPPATEGEWLGLEVAPITQLTATQYNIPPNTSGLVVTEAEAQAATVGIKAGDVVIGVNGQPVPDMVSFFKMTQSGALTQGVIELIRSGARLSVSLDQNIPTTPQAGGNPAVTQNGPAPLGLNGPTQNPMPNSTPVGPFVVPNSGTPTGVGIPQPQTQLPPCGAPIMGPGNGYGPAGQYPLNPGQGMR